MTRPRKSSIKRKIMRVIMLTSIAVLLVNVAALMVYDLITFRQTMVQNLVTQARTIADNSTAALAYNVKSDAVNVLAILRTNPHIIAAAIYDAQGKLFVKYPASITSADLPAAPQSSGHQFGNSRLAVFQPVVQSGRQLGTLYLQSDLTLLTQRIQIYGASSLFIMAGSLLVALWLSITLQRNISNPIIMLAETARKISAARDYSLRAPKLSEDELGLLTDSFNDMLGQIETGNAALRASEAQFRFVTDQAPVLLAHMDRDYRYKFVNRPYAERYRRTPDEIIGKHAIEVVGAELFERARPNVDKALAGQLVQFELEIPGVGNERRWSHVEYTPEKNAAGEIVGFVAMHIDITERKKIEQAVRESERRERERAAELAVVIEAVPVPLIIVHDAEARHMTGNQAADNLVRIPSGAEISISAPDNLKPIHFKSFKDGRELRIDELPAQRAARGELVKNFEFDLVFNDGTVLNLLGSGTPLLDEQGHSRGAVHTLVDITERKRAETILREAKDAAEKANRSKDDFLAALSHELRTPLNPVLLVASDAANNPQLPANTRADFDMIRRNVELEARLIDDLLDLTRITRGKLLLDMQPLDTLVVLQDAITTVQADAEQKHIALEFDFRADQYLLVGDPVRLRQIFWNVLKNAVKFTPEGGKIIIETSTLKENGKIAVKVSDTGIGLTADELKYIFNAFSQGEHAGTTGSHRFGGLGLGLAISRMLVELHSGTIQAQSAGRDQGATFTIEFPLLSPSKNAGDRDASPAQAVPANLPKPAKPKPGMRILLVEDHEPTRTILTHLLTRRHYIVLAAGSVAEANTLARRENFDLVLSDIGLPDGNGYALMSELRDRFGLRGIALTGYGMDHDVMRAKNAGFVTHLTKPVRMESLEKALADVS